MTADRVGDAVQAAVGKIQDAISGDTRAELEARARQAAGQAKEVYGEAVGQAQEATAAIERGVGKQPLVALLIAGAIGYAIGKVLHRR